MSTSDNAFGTLGPDTAIVDEEGCWRFLGANGIGRLAITTESGVDIFPINYLAAEGKIFFRSAPGSKIVELTRDPRVAFEADEHTFLARWSVVVRGTARRLVSDDEIERSGIDRLATWQAGDKFNYFEIQPTTISGRFIRPQQSGYQPVAGSG
jgi:nitroimidazol reductase NimA-like FMN-containing flavoprotein (pyridoxamine 5'-phosphate oxidase superfamily)